jgi:AbrB family looped-hinge helix DNA binding protein
MGKVTSKLQVTVPKALADRYGIAPGDEIEWEAAGDVIRVIPSPRTEALDLATRLRFFDQATERQREREQGARAEPVSDRGWTREELYERKPAG